jgi:hypothetical protein
MKKVLNLKVLKHFFVLFFLLQSFLSLGQTDILSLRLDSVKGMERDGKVKQMIGGENAHRAAEWSVIFEFDNNGNQILETIYSLDSGNITPSEKTEYRYDDKGFRILKFEYKWDEELNNFTPTKVK